MILAFAIILDPRYKLKFVSFAFVETHGNVVGARKVSELKLHLVELYKEYERASGDGSSACTPASTKKLPNGTLKVILY